MFELKKECLTIQVLNDIKDDSEFIEKNNHLKSEIKTLENNLKNTILKFLVLTLLEGLENILFIII